MKLLLFVRTLCPVKAFPARSHACGGAFDRNLVSAFISAVPSCTEENKISPRLPVFSDTGAKFCLKLVQTDTLLSWIAFLERKGLNGSHKVFFVGRDVGGIRSRIVREGFIL